MLKKLRDSYDLTKNMISRQARELMEYNHRRIIDLSSSDSGSTSDNVSTSSDDNDPLAKANSRALGFHQNIKLSVVRGLKLDPSQK